MNFSVMRLGIKSYKNSFPKQSPPHREYKRGAGAIYYDSLFFREREHRVPHLVFLTASLMERFRVL